MTLAQTDERKDTLKNYEELWKKFRNLVRSINNDYDDYDEKYMNIRFNSDDDLSLKKTLELQNIIRAFKSVFREASKYYPQMSEMTVCSNYVGKVEMQSI